MNDYLANTSSTSQAPADRAANWALGMAIASIACAGAGLWLAVTFGLGLMGLIPLVLGMLGWALCWAVGIGFAMGALKISYGSAAPGQVCKKAWGAIGLSAFSLVLVVLYIYAVIIAVQQIAE